MGKYERKIEAIQRRLIGQKNNQREPKILIGQQDSKPFYLTGPDLANSFHIMGATREGKSKQIENLYRQFIQQGIGGAIIDPHGYLYDDLLAYCSYQSARQPEILDRLVLFDPSDNQLIIGFNTLEQLPQDIDTLTLSRMYATIKARGKDNFDEMPTAKTWLYNIFYPLIKKGLTLIEAKHLIDRGAAGNALVQSIVEDTGIELIQHDWDWIADQSKRTQYEELLSSINMLRTFVTSERMELIFGRQERTINLRQCMDEGKIILVNLSSRKLHKDIARLLGTLLVNECFLAAMTRPEGARPFYLGIDEFENYVTQDIADVLDQGPKFGLHLVLAHHSLEQLKEQNKKVYTAVMQNAKIKILYGGLTYDNAEIMVKEMFSYYGAGGLDPMKEKRVQYSPYTEPHESTRKVTSSGEGSSEQTSAGRTTGQASQDGTTSIPDNSFFATERAASFIRSVSQTMADTLQEGSSTSYAYTESVVPFIEQELKWYLSGVQYQELDEQVYGLVAKMKNLPQQICMVKLPKQPVAIVTSSYIQKHHQLEGELERFAQRLNEHSPCHMTPIAARAERQRITETLTQRLSLPAPPEDDDRWQK